MTATPVALVALGVTFTVHGLAAADADRFRHLWASCLTETPPADPVAVTVTRTASGWRAEAAGRVTDLAGDGRRPDQGSGHRGHPRGLRRGQDHAHPRAAPSRLGLRQRRGLAVDRVSGAVQHYARPLAAEGWTVDRFGLADLGVRSAGETYLSATDAGATYDLSPTPPSVIVLFDRSAQPTSLRPVHRMDGLEELLRRCFTAHADPVSTLRVLAAVTRGAEVVRLAGDDPEAAAEELDAHVC